VLGQLPHNQRDLVLATKRYSFFGEIHPKVQQIIFLVDGKFYHGGFCDRLKGCISLFHYSLAKGIPFKIVYNYPFQLKDYLLPNEYDWLLNEEAVSDNFFDVRYMNLVGDGSAKRLIRLNTTKEIQCYANRDIVDELNMVYGANYRWGQLFKQLFKPTEKLAHLIKQHKTIIGGEYICAVYRFQNLLGDFPEYDFPELNDCEKEKLFDKMIQSIHQLLKKHRGKKLLVTSDSNLFLKKAGKISGVYTLQGKVVHIDTTVGENKDVYMKSFLDFYMLSEGEKIYSIGTDEMYKTEFPLYASKLNNIPFERILID
jgi:hypothetical protein